MEPRRIIILGAAGRDFHTFNTLYRDDHRTRLVAFTAQQIPHIDERRYPAELAGEAYPEGIPIEPESRLEELIEAHAVEMAVMAYSDVSHASVMELASRVNAAGASFLMPAPAHTMLDARRPVVAVCASRTGAGKSPTSRAIVRALRARDLRVAILRHPMPYGDLREQRVQRFETVEDLDRYDTTIEEREEYEPHIESGSVVWAGVDYAEILARAEEEADVILWDGGNNDTPFVTPDLLIVLVDPHRAGHELRYYPGATAVRMADVVIVNKVDTAPPEAVAEVERNVAAVNSEARIVRASCPPVADDPEVLRGRAVLAIEDGPTLTHGEMRYGAATIAARRLGATLVDPRPHAVGELAETLHRYPHLERVLPAMGYGKRQIEDLEGSIASAVDEGAEAVAVGTPIDLARLVDMSVPSTRVRYEIEVEGDGLASLLDPVIEAVAARGTS